MKTQILTAALVVIATVLFAQQPAEIKGQKSDTMNSITSNNVEVAFLRNAENTVQMMLAKEPGKLVKIKVYDGNRLLYTRRIKKEGTANITYDITHFPDGDYTFQLEKDKTVIHSAKISKGEKALAGK
jgi:hypothetical protein